jgi:hypothetical protein
MSGVSDLGVNASLLVAASDLNLVQSLLGAIRTADLTSAAERSGHPSTIPGQTLVRTVIRTVTVRNADQPAAAFEPTPEHQWHPRIKELQPYTCDRPVPAPDAKPSIEAPWKVLPWPKAVAACSYRRHRTIKAQAIVADESNVGRTLDLFV